MKEILRLIFSVIGLLLSLWWLIRSAIAAWHGDEQKFIWYFLIGSAFLIIEQLDSIKRRLKE